MDARPNNWPNLSKIKDDETNLSKWVFEAEGCDLVSNIDFVMLAKAYGGDGLQAESSERLWLLAFSLNSLNGWKTGTNESDL